MDTKGNRVTPGRKGLTALFLLVNDQGLNASDILPEAIKTVREKDGKDATQADNLSFDEDQYDAIAMMGHRIGFLENSGDLERYLQDAYELMTPQGQMLFTSLDMHSITNQSQNTQSGGYPGEIEMQFQYGNLIGPFFGLFHLDTKTLRTHVATTDWQCELLHQEDDDNYAAWLKHEIKAA
jgi:cyclopropane fatty-acyl-phospholipid synthase-like methyltransferase